MYMKLSEIHKSILFKQVIVSLVFDIIIILLTLTQRMKHRKRKSWLDSWSETDESLWFGGRRASDSLRDGHRQSHSPQGAQSTNSHVHGPSPSWVCRWNHSPGWQRDCSFMGDLLPEVSSYSCSQIPKAQCLWNNNIFVSSQYVLG